jgi:putative OPT family oligopeptide transporter
VPAREKDIPMGYILGGLLLFTLPLLALYQAIVNNWGVSIPMTVIMIVAGFLFVSVSAYMAGLVGSSNNPVSGLTICTILFAAFVLAMMLGRDSSIGAVAAIMIGAVVCCAACIGGDNLQDLKAGHLLGATPWKQQLMLGIGAVSSALVMAPVLNLLAGAYGIAVPPSAAHPHPLLAPQANLMASVAKGIFGGELPWNMIYAGMGIGAAIIVLDEILKARGAKFRVPVLACAVGIYLPVDLAVPIFFGGLLAHVVERKFGKNLDEAKREKLHQKGTLFSAGLITGEALTGIAIAVPIFVTSRSDVLALPESMQLGNVAGGLLGVAMIAVVGWWMYRMATRQKLDA